MKALLTKVTCSISRVHAFKIPYHSLIAKLHMSHSLLAFLQSGTLTELSQETHVTWYSSRGTVTSRDTAFTNLYHSQYIVNVSKLLFSIGNRSWCDRAWAMLEIFDEDFIIYAFCVLNIEIYLKLPRLKIRFQIKFIASPTTVSNAIRNS